MASLGSNGDPRVPSFVVDTLDALAPNCSVKLSAAAIRKTLAKLTAPVAQGTVGKLIRALVLGMPGVPSLSHFGIISKGRANGNARRKKII